MKPVFYGICIAVLIFGIIFWLIQSYPTVSEVVEPMKTLSAFVQSPSSTPVVAQEMRTPQKGCACCRAQLVRAKEIVRRRHRRQVTAKSPISAKQTEQLLETEKGIQKD